MQEAILDPYDRTIGQRLGHSGMAPLEQEESHSAIFQVVQFNDSPPETRL